MINYWYVSPVLLTLVNIKHKCSEQLNQQLENSYRNGDFSDVEVVCNTEVFKCHQFMLAARSPVLRAMFQSPMTEAASRRLEIKDLLPDIVDAMLLFIYTGNVPNLRCFKNVKCTPGILTSLGSTPGK